MQTKKIKKTKNTIKRGKFFLLLALSSLLFLLVLPTSIVSASNNKTTPATIIPTPDGVYIYITPDDNMSFLLQENTGTTFINDEGEVEYRAIHSPFGEVLSEGGIDPNSFTKPWNSWDDDVELYVGGESYDPKSGVWLGLHWPTLGSELGSSLWGAAKSIGTLGIYNAYQSYKYNFANPPASWGEVGLRTIDQTPVAGSVKAAIESDNWVDATSNGLNALGSGILIGTGLTAKFAPNTYAKLGSVNVWGGKAAAPTTTALVKYDPVFANWQKDFPNVDYIYGDCVGGGCTSAINPKRIFYINEQGIAIADTTIPREEAFSHDLIRFNRIVANLEKKGVNVRVGLDDAYLRATKAGAQFFTDEAERPGIRWKKYPTNAEIFEEIMHYTQFKKRYEPGGIYYAKYVYGNRWEDALHAEIYMKFLGDPKFYHLRPKDLTYYHKQLTKIALKGPIKKTP